jgi:hypothetical protein
MTRVVVAALLSAVVLFLWGFVFWTVLPFSNMVLKPLPSEEAVVQALKDNVPETGVYFFPFCEECSSPEAQEEAMKRHREGPIAQVIYRKDGVDAMSPTVFAGGFSHMFLSALLVGLLLKIASPTLPAFFARFVFVVLLGVFAAVWVCLADGIWFHHPWQFPVLQAGYNAGGWLVAALPMALVIRPRE